MRLKITPKWTLIFHENSYNSVWNTKVFKEIILFCHTQSWLGALWDTKQTLTNPWWEERLIIKLTLNPRHKVVNVFRRRTFDWFFDCRPVRPMVLVFTPGGHDGARLLCTELCYCTIEHVDLVEEVDSWAQTQQRHLTNYLPGEYSIIYLYTTAYLWAVPRTWVQLCTHSKFCSLQWIDMG